MIRVFIAALGGLGFAIPSSAQLISPRAFTQEFANVLRTQAPSLTVTIGKDMQLKLKDAAGKESTIFLDNAYAEYSGNPHTRNEVIHRYVSALLEPGRDDTPIDRSRIVPVVKDRAWLTEIQASLEARGAKQPLEVVFEDFTEDLVIVYAEDAPRNIRYLTPKNLTELGFRKDQLRGIAVTNLRKALPKIEVRPGTLVSMISAGGDYEASLLLLDSIWSSRKLAVEGDVVVAVPSRDQLLFTGSRNREGVVKLRELASKLARDASYRLTDRLFVYRDGRFQRFDE